MIFVSLSWNTVHALLEVIFQKRVRVFHGGFKLEETDESTRPQAECFYCFRVFETPMKHSHSFLKFLLHQKKISLNYHIIFETRSMHEPQKMCMMCMVLSPNCCAVTIFEYSTTEVTLPSCLSVPSEHVASQSK